jgi:acyl-CoA thioesterase
MSDPQAVADASARAMYAEDGASQALGMRILEVRPGYARLAMKVREDMVNGHKLCHGGLIFTLADSAFAFACNTYNAVTVA